MIKKISVLYFFRLVCSWFPRTTIHKSLCFSWWHCLIGHCDNWVTNSITTHNQVHWSGMKTVLFMPSHLCWINFYFLFSNQIIDILFRFDTYKITPRKLHFVNNLQAECSPQVPPLLPNTQNHISFPRQSFLLWISHSKNKLFSCFCHGK